MSRYPKADIYAITDSRLSLGRSIEEVVKELILADVKIIQYREKYKKAGEMLEECRIIRQLTQEAEVFFIVNDHIDIALLVGADGVHVGQEDLPVPEVRKLVGKDVVIGLSTHSPQEAQEALKLGADYIGVGPIYATETKEDVCEPVGLSYLKYVSENIDLPYVAIGGIKRHNIAEVVKNGGYSSSLISELVGAENIVERVKELRQAML